MRKCTPREVTSDLSEAVEHVGHGGTGIEGQVSLMLESGSSPRVALCNKGKKLRSTVVCSKHKTGIDRCEGLKYSPPSKVHTHTHTHTHTEAHTQDTHVHTYTHTHGKHAHTRGVHTHRAHTHTHTHTHSRLWEHLFDANVTTSSREEIAERAPGGRRGIEGLWQGCLHSKDTKSEGQTQLKRSAGNCGVRVAPLRLWELLVVVHPSLQFQEKHRGGVTSTQQLPKPWQGGWVPLV